MRISHSLLILATLATGASAQRPRVALRATPPARSDSPILQTVTFDVAAAVQEHYRASTEALVFGRFTVGLSGEYTRDVAHDDRIYYPTPGCPLEQLCSYDFSGVGGGDTKYRAWSFNIHGRWYPSKLSYSGERQSASVYFGEFIGYHERHITQQTYYPYPCITCAVPPRTDSISFAGGGDTAIFYPPVPYPGGYSYTQKLHGWEPGAEFGVRVMPARHIVIDIGGMARVETLQDPMSGTRTGGLVKKLSVAVGVGW